MVLSDTDLNRSLLDPDGIRIEPMMEGAVGSASIDLRLGHRLRKFTPKQHYYPIDPRRGVTEDDAFVIEMDGEGYTLHPFEFILGVTVEQVKVPTNMVCRVEGKSSLGRLGLVVHLTAGYIDPGNDLNITLELQNFNNCRSILLYPGMQICQVAFELTQSPCTIPYGPLRGSRYYKDKDVTLSRVHLRP